MRKFGSTRASFGLNLEEVLGGAEFVELVSVSTLLGQTIRRTVGFRLTTVSPKVRRLRRRMSLASLRLDRHRPDHRNR